MSRTELSSDEDGDSAVGVVMKMKRKSMFPGSTSSSTLKPRSSALSIGKIMPFKYIRDDEDTPSPRDASPTRDDTLVASNKPPAHDNSPSAHTPGIIVNINREPHVTKLAHEDKPSARDDTQSHHDNKPSAFQDISTPFGNSLHSTRHNTQTVGANRRIVSQNLAHQDSASAVREAYEKKMEFENSVRVSIFIHSLPKFIQTTGSLNDWL